MRCEAVLTEMGKNFAFGLVAVGNYVVKTEFPRDEVKNIKIGEQFIWDCETLTSFKDFQNDEIILKIDRGELPTSYLKNGLEDDEPQEKAEWVFPFTFNFDFPLNHQDICLLLFVSLIVYLVACV